VLAGPIAAHWAERATATAALLRAGAPIHLNATAPTTVEEKRG
jgi:hypothetical protein